MVENDELAWRTLDQLAVAVSHFLDPVLEGETGRWDPARWIWRSEE